MTPVPIAFWLAEPAPFASASGSTPRTKASGGHDDGPHTHVRCFDGGLDAVRPCAWRSRANSTIRMASFDDSLIVVSRPTWKYTSFDMPNKVAAPSAPSTPTGTTMMTEGNRPARITQRG